MAVSPSLGLVESIAATAAATSRLSRTCTPPSSIVRAYASAKINEQSGSTLQEAGSRAVVSFSFTHPTTLTDDEWADADPEGYEQYLGHLAIAEHLRELALDAHGTAKQSIDFSIRSRAVTR